MSSSAHHTARLTDSPNRLLGTVFGVVYLVVGLLGFVYTGFSDFAGTNTDDRILGIFEVNPLHNIAHLLTGALLQFSAQKGIAAARGSNVLVGGVYLLLGIVGLFILDSDLNILSLNSADNVLHLASAVLLLGVGLSQDRSVRRDVPVA